MVIFTWLIVAGFFIGFSRPASAAIVQNRDYSTPVASNDSNVNFYIGSSTAASTLTNMSVWLGDSTGGAGTAVSLRLTCFANDTTSSQTGCTDTSVHVSNSLSVFNTFGQEYFFQWSAPVSLQAGKYYLLEILGATGSDKPVVYGATTYQWANQCNFAGLGSQCTGTPYFTLNAAPDWTGLNATTTALTSLYQSGASSTLSLIQTRCAGSGNLLSEAFCAAGSFLFIPDPNVLNGFASLASTTLPSKFPFNWFYAVTGAFNSLTASSSANMAVVSIGYSAIDPATSTIFGPILPDVTLLSSSTINKYMPAGMLNTLLLLEATALWVIVGMFFWRDVPTWLHN